ALTDVSSLLLGGQLKANRDDQRISEVTQGFINARLDPQAILTTVTTTLSRLRSGTWLGTLLNRDPNTMIVVAANDSEPEHATLLHGYLSSREQAGQTPTSGLAMRVIESRVPLLRSG